MPKTNVSATQTAAPARVYELSILIPVYKAEEFLPRCLDSLVAQRTEQVEIVVVDDCSPGNCAEIVQQYQKAGHEIKYIRHNKNRGLMQSRITGIKGSSGRFVLPVDADDMLTENSCAEVLRIIADQTVDMITYSCLYGPERETMAPRWHNHPDAVLEGEEIREAFFNSKIWWMMCSKVFSRELCLKAAPFWPAEEVHINSSEDMVLFVPLLFFAGKCVAVNSFSYCYFDNPSSLRYNFYATASAWAKQCADQGAARQHTLNFLNTAHRQDRIGKMDELMHAHFVYLEQEARKLPDNIYAERLSVLVPLYNQRSVYNTLFDRGFPELCQAARHVPLKRKSIRRIAIFCESMGLGGAEHVAALLVRLFHSGGFGVMLCTDLPPQDNDYLYPRSIRRIVLPETGRARHSMVLDIVEGEKIDACILVSHHTQAALYDLVSCRMAGVWTIMQEHNMYFFPIHHNRNYLLPMRQEAYPLAHAITCLSGDIVCWWRLAGLHQTIYMPNPLTFEISHEKPLPREERRNNILFVGRLCREKGIFHLPHMLHELKKDIPDVTLTMLGRFASDEQRMQLEQRVQEYGLRDNLLMPGHVHDTTAYYKQAAVLVIASTHEGFGLARMEAGNHGVPSVMFEMDYLACVSESNGCIQVAKEDTHALVKAVKRLLVDNAHWQRMSNAAKNTFGQFADDVIMQRWMQLFNALQNNSLAETFPMPEYDAERMLSMTMRELTYALKNSNFLS